MLDMLRPQGCPRVAKNLSRKAGVLFLPAGTPPAHLPRRICCRFFPRHFCAPARKFLAPQRFFRALQSPKCQPASVFKFSAPPSRQHFPPRGGRFSLILSKKAGPFPPSFCNFMQPNRAQPPDFPRLTQQNLCYFVALV